MSALKKTDLFIKGVRIDWDNIERYSYLRNIRTIAGINSLTFHSPITFFVGENGSGKSTLLEAIDNVNDDNNNYFSWQSLQKQARVVNRKIKQFNEAAKSSPGSVADQFTNFPRKYFKVIINGDYMSGWSAEFKKDLDEYPDK